MLKFESRPESGKIIKFGKHKGKTIEQLHFMDYPWLEWTKTCNNLQWIPEYMESLPRIFPRKIVLKCGCNHPWGCKVRTATRFTAPIDPKGEIIAMTGAAYYWCDVCNIDSGVGSSLRYSERSLQFPTALSFYSRGNQAGFHKILRVAYGLKRVTAQIAYDMFWTPDGGIGNGSSV